MGKKRIGILGTGNASEALLVHFKNHGIPLSGLWGRNEGRAEELSRKYQIPIKSDPLLLIKESDFIIFAVSDRAIRSLAEEIHKKLLSLSEKPRYEDKVFLHLSGALSSQELSIFSSYGGKLLSAHMIQALPSSGGTDSSQPDLLENAWFSLEGDPIACDKYEEILSLCSNPTFRIQASDKPLYHAAMCVFSNYLVTLNHLGLSLLSKAGIPSEIGSKMIRPLIEGTLKNIEFLGPEAALTGPIARGDTLTVSTHLSELKKTIPENLFSYISLGLSTWDVSINKNEEMHELLQSELEQILKEKVKV